jgi:hypothetical protein
MVGSTGVPSSTNKFVTQDNILNSTTDQTQTTQNGTVELGEANATTKKNKIAQSFIPTKTKIRGVNLYKSADLGTFTGTVTVSLQADSSGSPSGSALATTTISNANYLALPVGEFDAIFTTEYSSLVAGNLYWIVIETSTSDNSNHPNIGKNTAGGYANGSVKYNNSTDGWTAISTIDLYFKTLQGVNNQIGVSPQIQTFLSSGTWIKPTTSMPFKVLVQLWGGGGSGAKYATGNGGAGGGGAYNEVWFDSSQLGATEAVLVGAGGAAQGTANTSGNAGGDSSFGGKAYAYGGGGGGNGYGGGGGGVQSAGNSIGNGIGGSPSMNIAGGFGYCPAGAGAAGIQNSIGGGGGSGATGGNSGNGGNGYFGGGGGSACYSTGGNSFWGGAGGGGAGPGSGGTSVNAGNGGAGSSSGTATSGSFPSGGGGATSSGTSGAGAAGKVIVTIFM